MKAISYVMFLGMVGYGANTWAMEEGVKKHKVSTEEEQKLSTVNINMFGSNYQDKVDFLNSLKQRTDEFKCTSYKQVSVFAGTPVFQVVLEKVVTLEKIRQTYDEDAKKFSGVQIGIYGGNPLPSTPTAFEMIAAEWQEGEE